MEKNNWIKAAYNAGKMAKIDGKLISENPYNEISETPCWRNVSDEQMRDAWNEGYNG